METAPNHLRPDGALAMRLDRTTKNDMRRVSGLHGLGAHKNHVSRYGSALKATPDRRQPAIREVEEVDFPLQSILADPEGNFKDAVALLDMYLKRSYPGQRFKADRLVRQVRKMMHSADCLLSLLEALVQTQAGPRALLERFPKLTARLMVMAAHQYALTAASHVSTRSLINKNVEVFSERIEWVFGMLAHNLTQCSYNRDLPPPARPILAQPDPEGALRVKCVGDAIRMAALTQGTDREHMVRFGKNLSKCLARQEWTDPLEQAIDADDLILVLYTVSGTTFGFLKRRGRSAVHVKNMHGLVLLGELLHAAVAGTRTADLGAAEFLGMLDRMTRQTLTDAHPEMFEGAARVLVANGRYDYNHCVLGELQTGDEPVDVVNIMNVPLHNCLKRRLYPGHAKGTLIVADPEENRALAVRAEIALVDRLDPDHTLVTSPDQAETLYKTVFERVYVAGHSDSAGIVCMGSGRLPLHNVIGLEVFLNFCRSARRDEDGLTLETNLPLSALINQAHTVVAVKLDVPDFWATVYHFAVYQALKRGATMHDGAIIARRSLLEGDWSDDLRCFMRAIFHETVVKKLVNQLAGFFGTASAARTARPLQPILDSLPKDWILGFVTQDELQPLWEKLRATPQNKWFSTVHAGVSALLFEKLEKMLSTARLPDAARLIFQVGYRIYGTGPTALRPGC